SRGSARCRATRCPRSWRGPQAAGWAVRGTCRGRASGWLRGKALRVRLRLILLPQRQIFFLVDQAGHLTIDGNDAFIEVDGWNRKPGEGDEDRLATTRAHLQHVAG